MKKLFLALSLATSLLIPACTTDSTPAEVANSKWGVEAAQACYDTVGTVIPYMECDAFEYKVVEDDYGDPAIWFYLYYETQEIAAEKVVEYAYTAWQDGKYTCEVVPTRFYDSTTYSYFDMDVLYADKVLSNTNAIEIQGLDSVKSYNGESKGALGLFCFNYVPNIDPNSFPSYAVSTILNNDELPPITGDNLTFDFSIGLLNENAKYIDVYVKGTSGNVGLEEQYFHILLENDYTLLQYDDSTGYCTDLAFDKNSDYPGYDPQMSYYGVSKSDETFVVFYYDSNMDALVIEAVLQEYVG